MCVCVYVYTYTLGGLDRVAVRRPYCDHKDVGSNPTATKNENWTLGKPPAQEVPQKVQKDLSGTSDIKAELDL